MANVNAPVISTPSRPRYSLASKRSGTFSTTASTAPNVAGFSPGGQVFEGYSYLSRSTSMSTSTRSRPKGLQSRPSDIPTSPPSATNHILVSSPSSPHIPRVAMSPISDPPTNSFDLPQRSNTIHRMSSSISTPELHCISIQQPRSDSEAERLAEAVANLPHNPKTWLPSQVALYLTHVLGLVPRPVVEDVTAYVRNSRMGGRAFLRLSEKDLERQGLNLKWRKLMIEAVRKLRRDALRGRIWGYESGSLRWPKSAQDLQREEAEDEDACANDDELASQRDGVVRSSKSSSKLTLKRMRDSRKVRGMIQAFQTSPEKQEMPLNSLSVDAPFGQGYVRDQAQQILSEAEEKKLSLRRPLRPRRSTADFPWLENAFGTKKEDIEALLANLTEQEAHQLADELGMNDLEDTEAVSRALQDSHPRRQASGESVEDMLLMPTLIRHGSSDSTSVEGDTSVSECSATESELDEDLQNHGGGHKPRYSVLDEDVIRAILAGEDVPADPNEGDVSEQISPVEASAPSQLTRSHTTASIVRPRRPYRASLYTDEELAALDQSGFHTRTESSRELVEALMSSGQIVDGEKSEPGFGTARLRSAEDAPPIPNFEPASPSSVPKPQQQPSATADDADSDGYIFTLPDAPLHKPTGSIRRTAGRKATFGSKRGKAVLSLLNSDAENSGIFSSLPGASSLRHKSATATATAEDEEGWGGTLSRSSSRKSLNGVFDMPVAHPPSTLRKRGLERVASEAEAEALHAKMDEMAEVSEQAENEVELPLNRYEETVLSEDAERGGMCRRTSVEERLSSLFNQGLAVSETHDTEIVPVESATTTQEKQEENDVEVVVAAPSEPLSAVPLEDAAVVISATSSSDASLMVESGAVEVPVIVSESESGLDLPTVEAITKGATDNPLDADTDSIAFRHHAAQAVFADTDTITIEPAAEAAVEAPATDSSEEQVFELIDSPASPSPDATAPSSLATPPPTSEPELLVPLTSLEPHPSGTGSIKKRSMVLVDRKRFESLARRMTDLEAQLESLDRPSSSKDGGLRDMFASSQATDEDEIVAVVEEDEEIFEDEATVLEEILAATSAATVPPTAERSTRTIEAMEMEDPHPPASPQSAWKTLLTPSTWPSYLSSLNPYYSRPAHPSSTDVAHEEEQLDLYALLGRSESEHERHLLSIGAIPAYMLGLGAGVGFVLVREVLGRQH